MQLFLTVRWRLKYLNMWPAAEILNWLKGKCVTYSQSITHSSIQDWKYAGLIKQSAEFHFGISIYSTSEFLDHWSFWYFLASLLILWAIVCFLPIYLGKKVQFININKTPNFCLKTFISEIRWFLWHRFLLHCNFQASNFYIWASQNFCLLVLRASGLKN